MSRAVPIPRRLARLLLVPLALLAARGAGAQRTGADVRGLVFVAGTEVGLAYSTVSVPEAGLERFVDPQGRFLLRGVPPGARRLRVRHIGYLPLDTTIVVPADSALAPLRLELRRAPQQLALVRVRAAGPCRAPGPPSPAQDPEFAALFQQLRQNAEQYRLLVRTYPFVYQMERAFGTRNRAGVERTLRDRDTLLIDGDPRWRYQPGRVVVPREPEDGQPGRGQLDARLPGLLDFADSAFQHSHCFTPRGVEQLDGRRVVRVDFRVDERLRTPDVNGSFFLDADGYGIVAADFELSRVPDGLRGLRRVAARTIYREIFPGVAVMAEIRATNDLDTRGRRAVIAETERQTMLDVFFLDAVPGRDAGTRSRAAVSAATAGAPFAQPR